MVEGMKEYQLSPEENQVLDEVHSEFSETLNLAPDTLTKRGAHKWAFLSTITGFNPLETRVRLLVKEEYFSLDLNGTERQLTDEEKSEYIETTSKITKKPIKTMGVAYEEFNSWFRTNQPASLNFEYESKDSESNELGDFVEDTSPVSVEDSGIQGYLKSLVEDAMKEANLTERENEILKIRMEMERPFQTYSEIGKGYGLTRERIRQIEKEAKGKIKSELMKRDLHRIL